MKFIHYLITETVFWLVQIEYVKSSSCSSRISWKGKFRPRPSTRLIGEWKLVNCAVDTSDNATLSFAGGGSIVPDKKKIKMEATNVFNITNLTLDDQGKYTCKVCNKERTTSLYIHRGINAYLKAFVIKEPDETLYDINSKVKLICTFGKNKQKRSKDYFELAWYKLASDGQREPKPLKVQKLEEGLHLLLGPLTQESEGTYECAVTRPKVNHYDFKMVRIKLKDRFTPKIHVLNYNPVFVGKETENFSLSYNVSSHTACNITWWKSKDGLKYQLITRCLVTAQRCEKPDKGNENITKTSFEIKDLKLPQDNLFYKLVAANDKGNDSKTFQIQVLARPRLVALKSKIQIYKKNLHLHCVLSKNANPENITYSWAYCDKDVASCQSKDEWKSVQSRQNNTIKILSRQAGGIRLYRCTADNGFKKDQLIWTIIRPIGQTIPKGVCDHIAVKLESNIAARLESEKEEKSGNSSMGPIVVWQGIVAFLAILLLVTLFLTFRRRNPPKQEYNTCVVPVLKEKIGDSV